MGGLVIPLGTPLGVVLIGVLILGVVIGTLGLVLIVGLTSNILGVSGLIVALGCVTEG